MNNKGQMSIMLSLLFFIMALGVMIAFIPVLNDFIELSEQSTAMNCKGYIYEGDASHYLSFNGSQNSNQSGSPIGCLAVKLYLPYILLVFLVAGISSVVGGKMGDYLTGGQEASY